MQHPAHPFDKNQAYDFLGGDLAPAPIESELAQRWKSLDDAGRVVASLAGEGEPAPQDTFVGLVERSSDDRRHAVEQGVDDLAAIMEPGLAALLYVCENGGDARAPAAALWREYSSARSALLALAPMADG